MIARHRMLGCIAMLATVAGCASPATRFYTLLPQSGPSAPMPLRTGYRIDLLPVTVPAQDDRPQLVVRLGDDRMALLEREQWIAPLADQIRAALSAHLTSLLGSEDIQGLPLHGRRPVYRIKLVVRRFESVPGRYVRIQAAWSVRAPGPQGMLLRCSSRIRESVGPGFGAMVRGHQKALAVLAARMATAIRVMAAGGSAHCP